MSSYKEVILDKRGDGTALLTLNRPEALNALNRAMVCGMREAIRDVEADPAVKILLLVSSTDKAFCAGIDLRERQALGDDEAAKYREHELFPMYAEMEAMRKPKVAAVNGHCLAGGFELAMTCDMIVAAHEAQFALTEVKWGVIPAAGGCHKLTRILGPFRAKEYIFTAKRLSAADALALGLINRAVDAAQLRATVLSLALDVIKNPAEAVQRAKRCIDNAFGLQDTAAFDLCIANENYFSETRKQGMATFGESKA